MGQYDDWLQSVLPTWFAAKTLGLRGRSKDFSDPFVFFCLMPRQSRIWSSDELYFVLLAEFYVRSSAGFKYSLPVIETQTGPDDPSYFGDDTSCRKFHALCGRHSTISVNKVVSRLRDLDDPVHGDDGQVFAMSCNDWNRESCSRRRWIWCWILTSFHAWPFTSLGIS